MGEFESYCCDTLHLTREFVMTNRSKRRWRVVVELEGGPRGCLNGKRLDI